MKTPLELFEKVVLRKNKQQTEFFLDNLDKLVNKSHENIQKVLEDRLSVNEGFTFSGNNLVCIEYPNTKLNTLLKFLDNTYNDLKLNKNNYTIPILGNSLKFKELIKSVTISHLIDISTENESFSKYIQAGLELLNIFGSNGENVNYAEVLELQFSGNFKFSGCKVVAKLVDLDSPRLCGIFRILLSQSDAVLQHLGLSSKSLPDKNIELHQKFKANLDLLNISWTETQELMEILSPVILLDDMDFTTSHYIKAGEKLENKYSPDLSKVNTKVCKLLGLLQTRFQDFFTVNNKHSGKKKIECLKKLLMILGFDYLVKKINESLFKKSKGLLQGKSAYKISLNCFPNPKAKPSIEGLVSNLMLESQEFAAYQRYLSVLSLFNEEKASVNNLSVPRCRYIIELFLDKNHGILYNFNSDKYWDSLKKEILGDSVYNKIISFSEDFITINNSWGSSTYCLPSLQDQYLIYPSVSCSDLLKKSSNKLVISGLASINYFTYQQYIINTLSELTGEVSDFTANIIYCYKDIKDLLTETSIISMVNVPYKYIISQDIVTSKDLKNLAIKFGATENYFLLDCNVDNLKKFLGNKWKPNEFNIDSVAYKKFKGPRLSSYFYSYQKTEQKRSSSVRSRIDDFSPSLSSISSAYSILNSKIIRLDELKKSFQSKKSESKSQYSKKNNKNYNSFINKVILIQSIWKGYKARKYFNYLRLLHNSASVIQAFWKGFKTRKVYNLKKIIFSVICVQRLFRKKYLKIKGSKPIKKDSLIEKIEAYDHPVRIPRRNSQKPLNAEKKPEKNPPRNNSVQKTYTFTPKLSKRTLEITEHLNSRENTKLKVEERLLLKEKQRIEKLSLATYNKKRSERLIDKHLGKIHNEQFYEQQIKYLKDKNESVKLIKDQISKNEIADCTFKPNLAKTSRSKSPMETIQNLYNWDQQRLIKREKACNRNDFEVKLQMVSSRTLNISEKIHKNKLNQDLEKNVIAMKLKNSVSPYWPQNK
jgi:IQ calmodulin-binding motif